MTIQEYFEELQITMGFYGTCEIEDTVWDMYDREDDSFEQWVWDMCGE